MVSNGQAASKSQLHMYVDQRCTERPSHVASSNARGRDADQKCFFWAVRSWMLWRGWRRTPTGWALTPPSSAAQRWAASSLLLPALLCSAQLRAAHVLRALRVPSSKQDSMACVDAQPQREEAAAWQKSY